MHIYKLIAQQPGIKPWMLLLLLIAAVLASGPAAAEDQALSPAGIMEAGHTGIGYVALNSVFGDSVIQHMYKPPGGINASGTDNGLVIAIGGFFAKIAFLVFAGFAATIATQITVKGVSEGNFTADSASIPLMFRWTSGIALAFPMPHLFGLALVQKVIIILAIASNGLANTAALEITKAAYVSPIGADIAAGSLIPLPPNPNIDGPAEAAFANMSARKMCAYHARSMGMTATETRVVCQGGTSNAATEEAWVPGGTTGQSAQCEKAAEYGTLHKTLCETTSYALNEAQSEIESALDISDEKERVEALKAAQEKYWQRLKQQRENFDAALKSGDDTLGLDPLEHVTELMERTGWPGLALTYSKISAQVEAMQTTVKDAAGREFNISELPEHSRIGEDIRNRMTRSLSEYEAAKTLNQTAESWGANFTPEPSGAYGKVLNAIAPAAEATAAYISPSNVGSEINSGAMWLAKKEASWLAGFFTAGSGLEAAYDFSHTILMLAGAKLLVEDILGALEYTPAGRIAGLAASAGSGVAERVGAGNAKESGGLLQKLGNITAGGPDGEGGSAILGAGKALITTMFTVLVICSAILAFIVPKLPAILIAIVVLDWVLTLLIIFVASPIWILMQLAGDNEDRSLASHQVKQGARYLAWVLLYPTLIVAGITISIMIVNIAIPLIATFVLSSTSDGLLANAFFIVSAPLILVVSITLIIIISMNLMVKIPDQISAFLSIQPFNSGMVTDAMSYMGAQRHIDQVQAKTSVSGITKL